MNNYHEEEVLGKAYDGLLAKRLIGYLYPYRWIVTTSVLLLLVVSGLRLVGPYLTKIAIDQHITPGKYGGLTNIAILFLFALVF